MHASSRFDSNISLHFWRVTNFYVFYKSFQLSLCSEVTIEVRKIQNSTPHIQVSIIGFNLIIIHSITITLCLYLHRIYNVKIILLKIILTFIKSWWIKYCTSDDFHVCKNHNEKHEKKIRFNSILTYTLKYHTHQSTKKLSEDFTLSIDCNVCLFLHFWISVPKMDSKQTWLISLIWGRICCHLLIQWLLVRQCRLMWLSHHS